MRLVNGIKILNYFKYNKCRFSIIFSSKYRCNHNVISKVFLKIYLSLINISQQSMPPTLSPTLRDVPALFTSQPWGLLICETPHITFKLDTHSACRKWFWPHRFLFIAFSCRSWTWFVALFFLVPLSILIRDVSWFTKINIAC